MPSASCSPWERPRRAEATGEAKSLFLANTSYEIRTPINAILGMNEMVLREAPSQQIREYAQSIHSDGSSLLYLVNDVLDIPILATLAIMRNKTRLAAVPYSVNLL